MLAEEGFARMWPRPHGERGLPRRETLPRAKAVDFDELPDPLRHQAGRAAPRRARPRRPRSARTRRRRRLPRHPTDPCRVVGAVPAGAQTDRHAPRHPRRRSRRRPRRRAVRRARRPPQSHRLDDLQLPADPRPATPLPRRARHGDARRRSRRRRRLRLGLPRRDALGRRRRPGKALRTTTFPTHPLRVDVLRPRCRDPQPHLRQRRHLQGRPGPRGARLLRPLANGVRNRPDHPRVRPARHHPRRARRPRRPQHPLHHPAHALGVARASHQRHRPRRLAYRHLGPRRRLPQTPSRRRTRHHHRLPRHRPPTHRARPRPRHPHRDHHQRPPQPPPNSSSSATPGA